MNGLYMPARSLILVHKRLVLWKLV